jgi:outer membrane protein
MMPKMTISLKTLSIICLTWLSSNASAGVLLNLYQQALANNPTLLSRQYAVDQAEAREDQAFSRLLPQVSASGNYSYNRFNNQGGDPLPSKYGIETGVNNYPGLRGTLQARQALFDLSSYLKYRSAESSTRQAEEEQEAYRMELAGDLVDRYLQTLEAVDKIAYLEEEKSTVAMQVKRFKELNRRQMATVTDLYEVEAYYQKLNTQMIEAENEKAIALERLREITGILPKSLDLLSLQTFPAAPVNVEQWINDAVSFNSNLSALKSALEAAEKTIASSKAEHLPQLALQMNDTYSDQGYDNRQLPPYDVRSVGLQLNVPIYEGGRVEASVREAIARRHILLQEFERVRRQIERETRTSFLNAKANYAKIDSTDREVEANAKAQAAQEKSYEYGVTTIVDLLESRQDVYKSETEHLHAVYDYARSLVMLRVWSGGLSMQNIEDIDKWFTK